MQLIYLVLALTIFVAHFVMPWWVLQWARRVAPASDTAAARLAGGLAMMGFAVAVAAPVVVLVVSIASGAMVAGADSASRATELARMTSTAMNCGAMAVFSAWGFTLLAALLLLRLRLATR